MKNLFLFFLLIVSPQATCDFGSISNLNFDIKFGFMAPIGIHTYKMLDEKVLVVDRAKPRGDLVLGFQVIPLHSDLKYECYTISYLPNKPKILSGDLSGAAAADYMKGIVSSKISTKGVLSVPLIFDEEDPLGEYKISIFINNKLEKTVKFDVINKE